MFSARLLNKEEPLPDRGKWQWEAQCGSVQLQCLLEPVQKDTASLFLKLKASATLLDGSQITPRSLTRNSQYLKRRHPSQHLQQGEKSGSTERSAPFPAAGGQNQQVPLPHRRLPDGAAGGGAVTPMGGKRTAVTARGGRAGRPQGGGTTRLSPRRSAGAGRAPGGTGRASRRAGAAAASPRDRRSRPRDPAEPGLSHGSRRLPPSRPAAGAALVRRPGAAVARPRVPGGVPGAERQLAAAGAGAGSGLGAQPAGEARAAGGRLGAAGGREGSGAAGPGRPAPAGMGERGGRREGRGGSERPGTSRGSESRWEKGALSWKLCGPRDGRSARVVSWGNLPPKMRFLGCRSLGDALDIGIQKVYSFSLYCYLTRSNTCMYEHDALCLSSGAEKQPLLAPRCLPS